MSCAGSRSIILAVLLLAGCAAGPSMRVPDNFLEIRSGAGELKAITPDDSPKGLPDVMADPVHQDLSTARVAEGEPAFDFELPLYDFSDGSERATGKNFRLSLAAAERPVALIFGSYT